MEYSTRVGGGEGEMEAFGYLFLDVDLHGLTSNHTLADCDGRFSVTEVTLSGVIRNHKEGGEWSDALASLTCHGPPPADWRGSFPRPRGMLHDVNERLGRELPALQDRVRKARALTVLLCLLVLLGAALLHLTCTRVDFDGREPGKTSLRVVLQRWHTPLTHAHRAVHFECRAGSCLLERGVARAGCLALAPPPHVCGEVHLS
mmetsp:Transcript_24318/g.78050  ORF Transcript_24318/g.78050 Transcript_24318/m.78050 type:complete len:203 (+) Transcript_24318:671-1279(+)